ncbi:unnamed protein product [Rotaria magnacalcarata]|uniref:Uncharacterized protein n=2 Tax=Rotaria magnacalcarata TaxID=392030 RepID=A0A815FK92_9BILA|nr:unnamed protein product [Rotaria magnacalcarata]CAF1435742.1 unnamed protein product [Rotaria magnacalcarata]CAF2055327.1 unnamed protein product [Rotaria magnacalcarata]CAF5057796.1 unnamed protein product [Rotaria magnacalcarata]CAF5128368.1 unnamed protein product [Rotaria magnacalcarata]
MPNCKHPEYLSHINAALVEGSITTCHRKAAFLAQLTHESGQLMYMEEIASGAAYEGRKDLGNTQPSDDKRSKGRGPIQLAVTSWTANGKAGVCREKATCVGNTFTGLRQGAASIQCCVTN